MVEKSSGQALVRIATGTAIAKEKSKGRYRIIVPSGPTIGWTGEVEGKGSRVGIFTPNPGQRLVAPGPP